MLTIKKNLLTTATGGMITYFLRASYTDTDMAAPAEVVANITFTQITDGIQGESSVVMSLYAPDGTVFLGGTGTLRLKVSAYKGAENIAAQAAFVWKAFSGGAWHSIDGESGDTLAVSSADVEGVRTFRCEMTYEGQTYVDSMTLMDRTDAYQAVIESTNGDTLLNGSSTILVCHLFQNGEEIDAVRDAPIGETPPPNPVDGQYWYRVSRAGPVVLCQYNAGSIRWDDLPDKDQSAYKYVWYRVDKDGHLLDEGAWRTGKLGYIGADMIDEIMTCKVEVDNWEEG